ncbi:hypothetical protein TNIN_46091 [Trichonephila inaurata madagascariensis]|uniref:Uncharacterized protein n=1 Tax=Trichonephila inaurata madagascariensis TaxID=2747483 RepID=A0A8X6X653_9ARAC|nr:hypothetical protein TNIN_46091 [Trichonephila inaurata madagascariensis]
MELRFCARKDPSLGNNGIMIVGRLVEVNNWLIFSDLPVTGLSKGSPSVFEGNCDVDVAVNFGNEHMDICKEQYTFS